MNKHLTPDQSQDTTEVHLREPENLLGLYTGQVWMRSHLLSRGEMIQRYLHYQNLPWETVHKNWKLGVAVHNQQAVQVWGARLI